MKFTAFILSFQMVFAISQRSDADIGSYNPSVSWKSGKLFNIKYILEFFGGLYVWNWWLYGTKTKISYWSILWIGTGSICLVQLLVGWVWPGQFGLRTSPYDAYASEFWNTCGSRVTSGTRRFSVLWGKDRRERSCLLDGKVLSENP